MARPRIRLLIPNDPHPMRIERDLAKEIGLNESIVLLQLEYLISISSNERDGRLWTYQTLHDLHEIYFPWWSVMTISRIVKTLEEKELIVIGHYNKLGYDRTQWYALNDVGIAKLSSVLMHSDAIYQNDKSIYQNDDMEHNKMINGTQQNDTTIPKSTHESTQREKRADRAPRTPSPERQQTLDSFNQAVLAYKELSGVKHIPPATITLIVTTVMDIERWRETIPVWVAAGFKESNVSGMLDWYNHPEKMAAHRTRNDGKNAPAPMKSSGPIATSKPNIAADVMSREELAQAAREYRNGRTTTKH